ncbi:MAG TPA: 4Fe-4S dicluster domain-containing protein [Syntrophomonadaceae bacterium]|nr:4Fe-4S dicluster domain-containing protein [Syntrophomonadaceae bacterium]
MAQYGLFVNYKFCTGCHACEIACQQENNYDPETCGLEVRKIGPFPVGEKWQFDYFVSPTDYCTRCTERVEKGKLPSCVQHCQTGVIEIGPIEELKKKLTDDKMLLFTLR